MKFLRLLPFSLAALLLVACTAKTVTTSPAASQPQEGAQPSDPVDPGTSSGGPETSAPKPSTPQGIGVLEDKGIGIIDGDPNAPATCKDVCTKQGGSCIQGLEPAQGSSSSVAGVATYVFVLPGQPAGFIPYDLPTCTSPVAKSEEATNQTGYLEKYECSCDGVAIPPRATVKASEGIHTCTEVCTSWGKTCTNKRTWEDGSEGGALAFYGTGDAMKSVPLNCATKPSTTNDDVKLAGYSCACE